MACINSRSNWKRNLKFAGARCGRVGAVITTLALSVGAASAQTDSAIHIDAGIVKNHITPWMVGSCIEDVNHEIYGGLYAQRIFGESFEEPPTPISPVAGWTAYGGQWRLEGDALHVNADQGAKLINDRTEIADGSVSCDVKLSDKQGTNAAILVRVSDAHTGADNWNGYEVAISARDQNVAIHRHHNDWHLLKTAPASIPAGRYIRMRVVMSGKTISLYLNDVAQPAIEFTDDKDPLPSGHIGIRTWESDASFRHVSVNSGKASDLTFRASDIASFGISGMWDRIESADAHATYEWDSDNPYNTAHSQSIHLPASSNGTAGVANRGLNRWGIAFRKNQKFVGSLYVRTNDYHGLINVALQSADGSKTYAVQKINAPGTDWKRLEFSLVSPIEDANGRLGIWIDRPGKIWLDQVTLWPSGSDLFRGQPIRADIANGLKKEGVRFLRYAGTMVNAPTYRWKYMLGDRDKRPQVVGNWYPQSTNGFGIEEFVRFCRDAHIEPAFAINIDETAQDAADMVEYLNGAADTPGGKRRAENGHPEPYGVRYIEIGNEEAIDGNAAWYQHYIERFEVLEPAMHAKDRGLQLVIAAWWRPGDPHCREIVHRFTGKAALWDVHVGGDGLRDGIDVDNVMTEMQAKFQEWAPGTRMKAVIFEENGGRHDVQRALGHAHILNVTERHGDFVLIDCPANCLQPWLQNDNGWDQGQLFFTPDKVWGMPPYFAQQMAAASYQPIRVQSEVISPNRDLDVTATVSTEGTTLIIKVVNLGSTAHRSMINLDQFEDPKSTARTWTLAGELTAVNSPQDPEHIRPVVSSITGVSRHFEYNFPAYSYTVIKLQRQ